MAETALAAFLNDAASRRVVQEIDRDAKVQRGTVRNAAWTFRTDRSPEVLLVDLDGEQNPIVYVPALMQVCRAGKHDSSHRLGKQRRLGNELYRSGVFLYLPKPLDATNLRQAMREVAAVNGEGVRPTCRPAAWFPCWARGWGPTP